MPSATVNGIELNYRLQGEGPLLVWGHGLMGSIAQQELLSEGLEGLDKRGSRVLSYDARGHGGSGYTEDESDYCWEAHARDLASLLEHLGLDRISIAGGSMGAGVAITFALTHPERVERLVLVAPPPLAGSTDVAQQVFGGFAFLIETLGLQQAVDIAMQLPQFVELKESDPDQYGKLRDWLLSQHPRAVVFAIRGLLNGPALAEARFGEISAPTLIVAHQGDPVHPESSARKLHDAIAGSRLVMAPDPNHYRANRDELLETVAGFLRGED